MADFLSASRAKHIDALPWLASQRSGAERVWLDKPLPTRKTEDWKYTNLTSFSRINFFEAASHEPDVADLISATSIDGLVGNKLVFINGEFSADYSEVSEQDGLELVCFSNASDQQQQKIQSLLNSCVDYEQHQFAALNTKLLNEGVFVDVSAGAAITNPIHIIHLASPAELSSAVNSRLIVNLQPSSSATVIEHYFSKDHDEPLFNNSMSELIVGENAALQHYRLMDESERVQHISGIHSRLARASRLNSFYLALGTDLTRVDISVSYEGEGAEAELNGVYLPKNKQHVDFHTCIEHAVPHCTSNETFRGIVADQAKAVFNGRIHIHPDAQKTEAYLSNKNLLTSNKAEVDTKPELEIYADDVKCAHGATVAQLDTTAMHYLKTRGISEDEAQVMLSFGFINELINNMKLEALADYCRPKLASRFSRDENLIRHIK